MISQPLFRRNFLIFAGVAIFFVVLAFLASFLIMSFSRDKVMTMGRGPMQGSIALLRAAGGDPVEVLRRARATVDDHEPINLLDLIDREGVSLVTGEVVLAERLSDEQLRTLAEQSALFLSNGFMGPPEILVSRFDETRFVVGKFGPRRVHLRGQPPPPPPGGSRGFRWMPPPPPPGLSMWQDPFWVTMGSLLVCVLASVGVSLMIFFSNYKKKGEIAIKVLAELKAGNLSARLPHGKLDELAPLVTSFNHMADEVERLVESLRRSDQSRRQLLQDLAHDLRTPLASLKTFLETLEGAGDRVPTEKRQEIMRLCLGEVEYFSNLVEDLLFLANITEPKYAKSVERVDLKSELESQLTVLRAQHSGLNVELRVEGESEPIVMGSQRLITRLLRNALMNASSFAQSSLQVQVCAFADRCEIRFDDDGPGFSERALQEFGSKKASREISGDTKQKRISVGIGSVIMREIANLHGGTLAAENRKDESGHIQGARVTITLARS